MANVSDDYQQRLTEACNASVEFSSQYQGVLHRFSVEQFYEMFAQEILFYKPIELLDGQVWGEGILVTYDCDDLARMFDVGLLKNSVDLLFGHIFERPNLSQEAMFLEMDLGTELLHMGSHIKGGYIVELGAKTALMPSIAVLQGEDSRYYYRAPSIGDVRLIAEAVDEKPPHFDLKLQALARAVLPEYWLLDAGKKQLEVYAESNGNEFLDVRVYNVGQKVSPLETPELEIRWW